MSFNPSQEEFIKKIVREEVNKSLGTVQLSTLKKEFLTRDEFIDAMDRMDRRFEESNKRFETLQKRMDDRFEESNKRFETLQKRMDDRFEESNKRFEESNKRFEAFQKRVDNRFNKQDLKLLEIQASVGSLGDRSGKALQETILELMREQLIRSDLDYKKIDRETLVDKDGEIFTKNFSTDVDVVAKDDEVHLYEVKYKANRGDIFYFLERAKLYEVVKGVKPSKLYIISLEIENKLLKETAPLPITIIAGKVVF
ncbi:MAG: hypothetical protein ACTSWY_07920 [Promethearchaeota archaeon]